MIEFDSKEEIRNFLKSIWTEKLGSFEVLEDTLISAIIRQGYLKKTRLEKAKENFIVAVDDILQLPLTKELMDAYEEELQQKNLLLEKSDND